MSDPPAADRQFPKHFADELRTRDQLHHFEGRHLPCDHHPVGRIRLEHDDGIENPSRSDCGRIRDGALAKSRVEVSGARHPSPDRRRPYTIERPLDTEARRRHDQGPAAVRPAKKCV
jgi:hypothetical protein